MDYQIGKLKRWDYIWVIVFILIIVNSFWHKVSISFDEGNIAFFGIIVVITLWIIDYVREECFNEDLKIAFIEELKRMLLSINDDIYLSKKYIENEQAPNEFAYLSKDIFDGIIASNKIIILKDFPLELLLDLRNMIKTIHRILDLSNDISQILGAKDAEGNIVVFERLRRCKTILKYLFTRIGLSQWYEEQKLKGTKYTLTEEETPLIEGIKIE